MAHTIDMIFSVDTTIASLIPVMSALMDTGKHAPCRPGQRSQHHGGARTMMFVPSLPIAISTTAFPPPPGWRPRKRGRRHQEVDDCGTCCICLETLADADANNQLPSCSHVLHAHCLWGMLTSTVFGSGSMMRCPLCREEVDRYDLLVMGYVAARPSRLRVIDRACNAFSSLIGDHHPADPRGSRSEQCAYTIQVASKLCASDRFLYNVCLLALERMVQHKRSFALSLPRDADPDTVDSMLACHVDVLLHISGHHQEDALLW